MTPQTTFVHGINPWIGTAYDPALSPKQAERITKAHSLYLWVRDNPDRTRGDMAIATGRSINSVRRITDAMVEHGLMTYTRGAANGARAVFVKVADAVH